MLKLTATLPTLSTLTCSARRMSTRREKAVYEEMVLSQSSYRLKSSIWGSVAFKIKSPNFSILSAAYKIDGNVGQLHYCFQLLRQNDFPAKAALPGRAAAALIP